MDMKVLTDQNISNNQQNWQELFIVNSNDNSNEGIIHKDKPFFQFNFIQKQELVLQILYFLFKFLLKDVKVFNIKNRIYEIVE